MLLSSFAGKKNKSLKKKKEDSLPSFSWTGCNTLWIYYKGSMENADQKSKIRKSKSNCEQEYRGGYMSGQKLTFL